MTRENKAGLAVAGVFLTLATTVGVMKWREVPGQRPVTMNMPPAAAPEPPKAAKVTPKPPEPAKPPAPPKPGEPIVAAVTPPAPNPGAMPAFNVVKQLQEGAPSDSAPSPSAASLPGKPTKPVDPKAMQEGAYEYVFQGPPSPEVKPNGGYAYVFQGPPSPADSTGLSLVKNETTSSLPAVPGADSAVLPLPPEVPGVIPPIPEIIPTPSIPLPAPLPGPGDATPSPSIATPKPSAAPLPDSAPAPKVEPPSPIPPIIEPPESTPPPVPGGAPLPPIVSSPLPPVPPVPTGKIEFVGPPAPPVQPAIVEPIITPPAPPLAAVKPVPPTPAPTNPVPPVVKGPAEKTSSGTPLEGSRFVPTVTLSPPIVRKTQPPTAGGSGPKAAIESAGNLEPVQPAVKSPADGLQSIAVPTPSDLTLKPVPGTPPSASRSTLPSSTLPSAKTNVVQIAGGVVSAAPATPKVTRYDTQMHVCKQEDTWESISTQHLLSKNWADALRAFNMQSRFQNERVRGSGVLQAGDTVYIPPASVLESNFPTLIRK